MKQSRRLVVAAVAALGLVLGSGQLAVAADSTDPLVDPSQGVESVDGAATDPAVPTDVAGATDAADDSAAGDDPVSSTDDTAPPEDDAAPPDGVPVTEPAEATDPQPAVEPHSDAAVSAEEGEEGGEHGGEGSLPPGVVVTVDGRDIKAGDPAGSLPKIAGCSFEVAVSGLAVDPAPVVGVRITAWPPTAAEEQKTVLVDASSPSADGVWSGSFPLDDVVGQFERKPNGYHMRFEIFVDGAKGAMKMYWLGCGAPQTGNPRRVVFETQWNAADGSPVTAPLDTVLPIGWRDQFALTASSERGTAVCGFEEGSDLLTCTYDNPGHGDQPGLVLPGEPGTEYEVTVTGVPAGWHVDPATVGVFLADTVCPKGGHGGEEGEEGEGDAAVAATPKGEDGEEGEEKAPCVHTVVLDEQVTEPPDDDGEQGGGGGGAVSPEEQADVSGAELPVTGADVLPSLLLGLSLVLAGASLVAVARRRRPHPARLG